MESLPPAHRHVVRAAEGWLELGNMAEAERELAAIDPAWLGHFEVLEVRWQLHVEWRQWNEAVQVGAQMVHARASDPAGWINRSFALHELGQTREAWDLLLPAAEQFREVVTIPYNLACYACQMGDMETAREWLSRAIQLRDLATIQRMAEKDPDLVPLRSFLKTWDQDLA